MADRNMYDLGRGIAESIIGPKLTPEERYNDFLNETKYFNEPFDKRIIKEQTYYIQMGEQDRREHLAFLELINVARNKKAPNPQLPPNLDTLGNAGFEQLALDETAMLYNKPGVRVALETIVEIIDTDVPLGEREDGTEFSLRTVGDNKSEVDMCRQKISELITDAVLEESRIKRKEQFNLRNPDSRAKLETRVREAEQIAFTLAYIGGVFDAEDSVWSNVGRVRAPKLMNEYLVNVPMKLMANPMDWLVGTFKKAPDDVNVVGAFGRWAYEQVLISNNNSPLSNIETVEFIADENDKKQRGNFWKVTNNGERVIVPECYPRKMIRSVFEETTVEIGDRKIPLIDFIRGKQEIPWNKVTTTMWSDFSSKLKKASVISDHLQGNVAIKWGAVESYGEWVKKIDSALSKFGLRKQDSLKRWILYATLGVDVKKREPTLRNKAASLTVYSALGPKNANYLPSDKLKFPWD